MNRPMSKEDVEFLEAVNHAKSHDRTAYNCILLFALVFEYGQKGQAALSGAIWQELSSLSKGEYKRMIKLNREKQRESAVLSADIESAINFIRSHLIARAA